MKQHVLVERSTTPDGGEIALYCHDGSYTIRINGLELMSTRQHHSEEVLAEHICRKFHNRDTKILIGGLGFGFTLKAVLDNVSPGSSVVTAELMECVIKWNSNPEFPLAHLQINDKRSKIIQGDVTRVIKAGPKAFDAIILDVDNGPDAMTTESNHSLYGKIGLQQIKTALKPGGALGIWSAAPDAEFGKLMKRCGFRIEIIEAKARPGKGSTHTLFIGHV